MKKPPPVFSDYGRYGLPPDADDALIQFGLWKFKYRDSQPALGDKAYVFFDNACKRYGNAIANRIRDNRRMQVNSKVR